jgi:hypothetical protein
VVRNGGQSQRLIVEWGRRRPGFLSRVGLVNARSFSRPVNARQLLAFIAVGFPNSHDFPESVSARFERVPAADLLRDAALFATH